MAGVIEAVGQGLRRFFTLLLALPLLFFVLMISENLAGALPMAALVALKQWVTPEVALQIAWLVTAAAVTGVYGGVPVTRFALRVFPLRADGRRRWGVMALLVVQALGMTAAVVWMNLHPAHHDGVPPPPSALAGLTGLVVVFAQTACALALYARRGPSLPSPSVLYLRRFRSFSDRAVYRALLTAAPAGAAVVTLVPPTGGPRDLDPLTIGFAGFRWRHPLRGIPRTHVSANADWQRCVTVMMQGADLVVVDGSADSDAMRFEYDQIAALGLGPRTVVMVDEGCAAAAPRFDGAARVVYRRNVSAALPRALVWLGLFGLYLWAAWRYPVEYPSAAAWGFLLIVPALWQKAVDRESVRALKRQLAARLPQRPAAGLRRLLGGALAAGAATACLLLLAQRLLPDRTPLGNDPAMWNDDAAWSTTARIELDDRTIVVPVPDGFVDASTLVVRTRTVGERFAPPGERHLLALAPRGYVYRQVFDEHARVEANLAVYQVLEWHGRTLDDEAMAQVKAAYAETMAPGDAPLPSRRDGRLPEGLSVQGLRWLGVFDERSRSISALTVADVSAQRGDWHTQRRRVCAQSLARVRGELLHLDVCREAEGDADTAWVKAMTRRWIEQLSARN